VNDGVFRRVQRYGWDAAARAYADGWVPLLGRLTRACVARAGLRAGERVLDLATGPGVAALEASRQVGPAGAVHGVDISEQMIAVATASAAALAHPNLTFARNDMETTGAPDAAFDAVVSAFGLMYAADRRAVAREMARVLVPGGRVSVAVWGRRSACGWAEVFPIIDARVESEVCPLFFSTGVPGALRALFELAGFTEVVEERLAVTLEWASGEEAASAMLAGGPVALAWKRFSPEVRAAVQAEYLASIAAYRVGTGYAVPSEVVFATARRGSAERSVPSQVTPLDS
jgi:ubiquinone/menaquinone biosynthesis C-methylase UbiE